MRYLWLFNEKRLLILRWLLGCDAARGCDLKSRLHVKKTLLSYHLGVLRDRHIIDEMKQGREKYYRIRRSQVPLVRRALRAAG